MWDLAARKLLRCGRWPTSRRDDVSHPFPWPGSEGLMGAVYEQFESSWTSCGREAGKPRREMVHLLLLALEREEIVSVGYREAMIARRLAGMPIGPQLRELIAHALAWAWKDEEMHAIYLRGAILRLGSRSLKAPGLSAPGGRCRGRLVQLPAAARPMASSPLSPIPGHDDRRDGRPHRAGPPRRPPAPPYGPFRDFCLFNVDAELTARRCYEHAGAGPEVPELSSNLVDDLRRSATTRIGTSTSSPSWPRRSTRRTVSRRGDARRGGPADRRGR